MKKMRKVELTVLSQDIDRVLEFLGREAQFQLVENELFSSGGTSEAESAHNRDILDNLALAASWLDIPAPEEPLDTSRFPGETEEALVQTITEVVSSLRDWEKDKQEEKNKINETLNEIKAFTSLNAPFSELEQLSYLTLRIGHLDPKGQEELRKNLSGRAMVIPLGGGDRFLAAASRKGRFALDSELKKKDYIPITIPEGYKGIPSELLSELEGKLEGVVRELEDIAGRKAALREEHGESLKALIASYLMEGIARQLKSRLHSTKSVYFIVGWVPAEMVKALARELEAITRNKVAIRVFEPEELDNVKHGKEKVPVFLDNNAFVKGFERLVFSYGVPLYGTVDPTPIVAFFFTLLFGIMFGDLGQGMVLLLLGFLSGSHGVAFLSKFRHFSIPLMAVGISSMVMGFLNGSFFAHEEILIGPTRFITGLLTGQPMDRIIVLMPLPERGGSIVKLFYFFGFTAGLGALLNSVGLIVNTTNKIYLKKYEEAFLERTGLAGLLLFWYALFIGVRFAVSLIKSGTGFELYWFDALGLALPMLGIVLGSVIWRLFSGKRPVFEEGFSVFFVKGFVEILDTVSTMVSNSVSFLRVGAFAFSHAVLSYIIFWFVEEVSVTSAGTVAGVFIMISGNVIIILLEGLIVAIQVVRLQYYEFFSKFFVDSGVEFSPFRFRKGRS